MKYVILEFCFGHRLVITNNTIRFSRMIAQLSSPAMDDIIVMVVGSLMVADGGSPSGNPPEM